MRRARVYLEVGVDVLSSPIVNQMINRNFVAQNEVIIEIEELFRQSRYAEQVVLDGTAAKGGQIGAVSKNVLVCHQTEARVVLIYPAWYLAIGHQIDVSDPTGRKHF